MPAEIDLERVRSIIADVLEVRPELVVGSAHFMHDLGGDSLRVIEIITRLESELNVTVDQSEMARMVSLDAVCEVLQPLRTEG
jgi:acyl carrier protein